MKGCKDRELPRLAAAGSRRGEVEWIFYKRKVSMNAVEIRKLLYEMVATNKQPRRHYKRFIGDIMTEDYGCYILENYYEHYIFNPSQTAFNYPIIRTTTICAGR